MGDPQLCYTQREVKLFSSLHFLFEEFDLSARLSRNGCIFLCPSHEIGHDSLYRPVRQIFGNIVPLMSQVERNVVRHPQKL